MIEKLKNINEHLVSFALLVLTSVLTWYSLVHDLQSLQVISLMLLRTSLFLTIGSLFIKFLNGFCFNINDEIFKEHNTAAAITIAGFWIGLAIALASAM